MKTSIALVGFMGVGKTVVGRILAEKMGKEFIELDALIEKRAGKSIPDIFQQEGEIRFRELEIEAAAEVADKKNVVIACGGGLILNKINVDRLQRESVVVCLTASPAVILKRTSGDGDDRPLLAVKDRQQQIAELLRFRRPFYERAAEITVNTSRMDVDSVARVIMEKVSGNESYHQ